MSGGSRTHRVARDHKRSMPRDSSSSAAVHGPMRAFSKAGWAPYGAIGGPRGAQRRLGTTTSPAEEAETALFRRSVVTASGLGRDRVNGSKSKSALPFRSAPRTMRARTRPRAARGRGKFELSISPAPMFDGHALRRRPSQPSATLRVPSCPLDKPLARTPDASTIQVLPESHSDFPLEVRVDSWPLLVGLALLVSSVAVAAFVKRRRAR